MSGKIDYLPMFEGCLLILLVGYVPTATLGAAAGRFIRRHRKRAER